MNNSQGLEWGEKRVFYDGLVNSAVSGNTSLVHAGSMVFRILVYECSFQNLVY